MTFFEQGNCLHFAAHVCNHISIPSWMAPTPSTRVGGQLVGSCQKTQFWLGPPAPWIQDEPLSASPVDC